jgi:hypothetical protein
VREPRAASPMLQGVPSNLSTVPSSPLVSEEPAP